MPVSDAVPPTGATQERGGATGNDDMGPPLRHESDDAAEIPEMRPWREAGWIFRDGDARAIERRVDRTSLRRPQRDG
jgi:hypothetical protein